MYFPDQAKKKSKWPQPSTLRSILNSVRFEKSGNKLPEGVACMIRDAVTSYS